MLILPTILHENTEVRFKTFKYAIRISWFLFLCRLTLDVKQNHDTTDCMPFCVWNCQFSCR